MDKLPDAFVKEYLAQSYRTIWPALQRPRQVPSSLCLRAYRESKTIKLLKEPLRKAEWDRFVRGQLSGNFPLATAMVISVASAFQSYHRRRCKERSTDVCLDCFGLLGSDDFHSLSRCFSCVIKDGKLPCLPADPRDAHVASVPQWIDVDALPGLTINERYLPRCAS